jgi:hypothetical protein
MKYVLICVLMVCMTTGFTCQDLILEPVTGQPGWVDDLILSFKSAPVGNPPQSIWQYEYNGATVYFVPPQCCDQYSDLYSYFGVIIAHPDGGITGSGDGRATDFFTKRTKEVLIWKDDRKRN